MNITTLHSLDTEYSADSIEWCPTLAYRSYFACGTYQLEEGSSDSSPCRRKGRILLFKFLKKTKELTELHRVETPAILDMKWLHQTQRCPLLAVANGLGQVMLFELKADSLLLRSCLDINAGVADLLTLSLDGDQAVSDAATADSPRRILTSDSKGGISLLQLESLECLQITRSWPAHSFEAWICAFDKWDRNLVYSGGDDCMLCTYDLRTYARVSLNKCHNAGVTCLLSHPRREHLLLTGSYDDNMRLFDTRRMKSPLGQVDLGGGIWRLKADPVNGDSILAACMYHNFSIVQLTAAEGLQADPKIVGEYNEHESICYGADWCLDTDAADAEMFMATCSFYDHKLCVASIIKQ